MSSKVVFAPIRLMFKLFLLPFFGQSPQMGVAPFLFASTSKSIKGGDYIGTYFDDI